MEPTDLPKKRPPLPSVLISTSFPVWGKVVPAWQTLVNVIDVEASAGVSSHGGTKWGLADRLQSDMRKMSTSKIDFATRYWIS
jgi:hypothetical protein